jgi:hypothetical protein
MSKEGCARLAVVGIGSSASGKTKKKGIDVDIVAVLADGGMSGGLGMQTKEKNIFLFTIYVQTFLTVGRESHKMSSTMIKGGHYKLFKTRFCGSS